MNLMSKEVLDILDRPVAFHRAFVRVTGGIVPALMLSQGVFWTKRTKDDAGWFWPTQEQWEDETGLTRYEQESAREKLLKTGFWEEKRTGIPAKLHYRINLDELYNQLISGKDVRQENKKKGNSNLPGKHDNNQECGVAANKGDELQQAGSMSCNEQYSGVATDIIYKTIREQEENKNFSSSQTATATATATQQSENVQAVEKKEEVLHYAQNELSPVAQALADNANRDFDNAETEIKPGEYLPGLTMPKKRKAEKITAENYKTARMYGIDATSFRVMVDTYLDFKGTKMLANGTTDEAEIEHRKAQSFVIGLLEMSAVKYCDEKAIRELLLTWKQDKDNEWCKNPTNSQILTYASRLLEQKKQPSTQPKPPATDSGKVNFTIAELFA